jgi:hypothetical protein
MNARQNVAGDTSAHRVGLDDGERAFLLGFGQSILLLSFRSE